MNKVLFLQPGYAHYRDELFYRLSQRHAIHFLFEKFRNTYPGKERPGEISYTFIDKRFRIKFIGLIYYLFKYQPDIIITSVSTSLRTIISFFYATIFRKRFILWILEWRKPVYKTKNLKYVIRIIRYWIGKKIIIKSHALVVGGTAAHNYALSLGKPDHDIFVAPQCSKDIQNQKKIIYTQGTKQNKHTFLYLSRIIPWKGLDILIRAFCLLKMKREDVSLLIAGDGPSRSSCYDLAKSLGVSDIQFLGAINSSSTRETYEKADIFVLPSYELDNDYEVWGLVINEAMSMGRPVITTTAVGASYDLVFEDYNGFIVEENNVEELCQAMDKILKSNLVEMGVNSRRIFEEKNIYEKMANGFTKAITYVELQL
jgi:glycosyltransferase involved in cell wall biosynthesis